MRSHRDGTMARDVYFFRKEPAAPSEKPVSLKVEEDPLKAKNLV